jgi:hypothetical protein
MSSPPFPPRVRGQNLQMGKGGNQYGDRYTR